VSAHDAVVAQALECGKHVLCEKPLCADVAAARRLVALAERCGRVLMVGNVFLFNAGILKLKELLDNGEIGELHYLTAVRTNLGPIRSDVNAAFDLATHDIAIFNWLLGSLPIEVTATGAAFVQPGIEDVVFITLRYPGGILANIHASWLSPRKVRQITLVGSRRMATWDDLELVTPVAVFDKGATAQQEYGDYGQFLRLSMWDGDVRLPKIVADEPLKVQNRAFLAAVRSGRAERSDGAFSLGVVQTLDAVRRSLAQHGCAMAVAA
jgi:predicted dehydrogenase